MLILLSLAIYLVLGLPIIAWLGHRLAQAHPDIASPAEAPAPRPSASEVLAR